MSSCSESNKPILARWIPVFPPTEKIKELAKWAVHEANKKRHDESAEFEALEYIETTFAEEQKINGVNYRITIKAYLGHNMLVQPTRKLGTFEAFVRVDLNDNKELKHFVTQTIAVPN